MRYFIRFSYNGTNYHGSQVQPNGNTVQAELERALSLLLRTPISTIFAGRTDAGVHAETMYAHFDVENPVPDNLAFRINGILPEDIAVTAVLRVRDDAHARFDATSRTYEYRIINKKDVFCPTTRTRVRPGLDIAAMNDAAKHLLGKQDFASFCRAHTDVKTTICDVRRADWTIIDEDTAVFTITADRFLRNMVRAVVGTLFDVGYGKTKADDVVNIIRQMKRSQAGQSAPAEGLFLTEIVYPEDIFTPSAQYSK